MMPATRGAVADRVLVRLRLVYQSGRTPRYGDVAADLAAYGAVSGVDATVNHGHTHAPAGGTTPCPFWRDGVAR